MAEEMIFGKRYGHTPGKNHRNENYYVILLLLIDEGSKRFIWVVGLMGIEWIEVQYKDKYQDEKKTLVSWTAISNRSRNRRRAAGKDKGFCRVA